MKRQHHAEQRSRAPFAHPCPTAQLGSLAVGIQTAQGIVLAAEKRTTSPLLEKSRCGAARVSRLRNASAVQLHLPPSQHREGL